ncbi:carboxylesterase BioH [Neisseria wadsworthii 9715]|uniref:Carboxylesterase BioH n=1 Tax=Neisseria wadsworthii 9715 TaxID=1030841 RepID=G4CTQ6_9NEIS|nr:carboxylesterase BioH [Neisseria wadsworthii 9715]
MVAALFLFGWGFVRRVIHLLSSTVLIILIKSIDNACLNKFQTIPCCTKHNLPFILTGTLFIPLSKQYIKSTL